MGVDPKSEGPPVPDLPELPKKEAKAIAEPSEPKPFGDPFEAELEGAPLEIDEARPRTIPVKAPTPAAPAYAPTSPRVQGAPRPVRGRSRRAPWGRRILIAFTATLLTFGIGIALALPAIVKSRLQRSAKASGVELEIGTIKLHVANIEAESVTARVPSVPSLKKATVGRLVTPWSGASVLVENVALDLEGGFDAVQKETGTTRRDTTIAITVTGLSVAWRDFFGPGTSVDAKEGRATLDTATSNLSFADVRIQASRGTFGPYAATASRDGTRERLHLLFDPKVPGGPYALLVRTGTQDDLAVRIPRVSLGSLGIPTAPAAIDVEFDARLVKDGDRIQNFEMTGGAFAKGDAKALPLPEVKWSLQGSGTTKDGVALRGPITTGGLVADSSGNVRLEDAGPKGALTLRFRAMPCDAVRAALKTEADRRGTNEILSWLLTSKTTALKGRFEVTGHLNVDFSKTPALSARWEAKEACTLQLFRGPW